MRCSRGAGGRFPETFLSTLVAKRGAGYQYHHAAIEERIHGLVPERARRLLPATRLETDVGWIGRVAREAARCDVEESASEPAKATAQ